jgi:hypothetical protein
MRCGISRMINMIMSEYLEVTTRLKALSHIARDQSEKTRAALNQKSERLMGDFTHGMMGSEKLKKDPLVSIVSNLTNSPGAVQQIGVGTFSQTAATQQYNSLVDAIDSVVASPEFDALSQDQKDAFTDISDALKTEVIKPNAGNRLVALSTDIGLRVAANAIAQVLARMFMGG